MGRIKYILIGSVALTVIIGCILLKRPDPIVNENKYKEEMKREIDQIKTEINDIQRNLIKQYEKDDTVSTSSGVSASNREFIKRTGWKLPPGHPDR